jgi:molybdenum ABC transporter molybdate-binding protein
MGRGTQQPGSFTIEHALLGLVRQQPRHGYEIYQQLRANESLALLWPIKQSQCYALLGKLEQAGYLCSTIELQGPQPPRKVFCLTDAGEAALSAWANSPVTTWEDVQQQFLARLYFVQQSGEDAAHALVERQRSISRSWLDSLYMQQVQTLPHSHRWQVLRFRIRQIEAFLEWLDTCISRYPDALLATYSIAALADSPRATLAQQFLAYVCSPAGQAALAQHGFLPACKSAIPPTLAADAETPGDSAPVLRVLAATSLTDAFHAIGQAFGAVYGVRIECTFAGSQHLAGQLIQGVPADVFASAHHLPMQLVTQTGRVAADSARVFAHNRLAVVTPRANPARLPDIHDLAKPGYRLVLGSRATAVGLYALDLLAQSEQGGYLESIERAAVLENVACYGETPADVLDRVIRGDADGGIVFMSDYQRIAGIVAAPIVYPAGGAWTSSMN